MSRRQGMGRKSTLGSNLSRRPLLNYLRSGGGAGVVGGGSSRTVEQPEAQRRIDFKSILAQQPYAYAPPASAAQQIHIQPVQPIPQPIQAQPGSPLQPNQPTQSIPQPALNVTSDPPIKLSQFLQIQNAVEEQNRLLTVGNIVDSLALGIFIATTCYLAYILTTKTLLRTSVSKRRQFGLLGYILLLLVLSATYLVPSILSRMDHIHNFLRASEKAASDGSGKKVLDIGFDWWDGCPESELPLRMNLMMVDCLMGYLVFLTWRDDPTILTGIGGLLAARLIAELVGYPFILPLLFEVVAAGLIISRVIIDKKQEGSGEFNNNNNNAGFTPGHARGLSASTNTINGGGNAWTFGPTPLNRPPVTFGVASPPPTLARKHITPTVSYILAAGLYTDLRIFELVAALYGVGAEDIWLNTLVFGSAFLAQAIIIAHWIAGGPMLSLIDELRQASFFPSRSVSRTSSSSNSSDVSSNSSSSTIKARTAPITGSLMPGQTGSLSGTQKAKSDPGGL